MVLPIAPPAIGFRDVAAHADRFEIDQLLITVVALVGDDLVEALALGHHDLDPFSGLNHVSTLVAGSPSSAPGP